MAERRLIALAQQIEQRRALREIVIRIRGAAVLRVERAAQPQVLAPCGRRHLRIERIGCRRQTLLGFGETIDRGERLGRD